jgi:hypothetical protein
MRPSGSAGSATVYAENDARFLRIVGRHLDANPVSGDKTNETFPHFSGNVGENEVPILQLNPKHGAGEHGVNGSFKFYGFVVVILHTGLCGGRANADDGRFARSKIAQFRDLRSIFLGAGMPPRRSFLLPLAGFALGCHSGMPWQPENQGVSSSVVERLIYIQLVGGSNPSSRMVVGLAGGGLVFLRWIGTLEKSDDPPVFSLAKCDDVATVRHATSCPSQVFV